MANIIEPSTGYNWDADGVYQIEKSDPVEGGVDGVSNRQARQLAHRTRDLHARLAAVKTDLEAIEGGSLDVAYDTLLKLQNKLKAVEAAINGDNGDTLIETLQEALGFINEHKTDIESLVATYVKKSVIADNLTTSNPGYVLSAQQGVEIKRLIDVLTGVVAGKETPEQAQQKADAVLAQAKAYTDSLQPYDYIVDSNEKLIGLNNNPLATNVLIRKGTWSGIAQISLHANTKRIRGEEGSEIRGCNIGYSGGISLNDGLKYSIDSVRLVDGTFLGMINMMRCCVTNVSQHETGFDGCVDLFQCYAFDSSSAFERCSKLYQCQAAGNNNNGGFFGCVDMLQCVSVESSIVNCYLVNHCLAVSYSSSYSSPAANNIYLCALTLNGGWNKTFGL